MSVLHCLLDFFLNKTTLPELGYLFSNILALCTSTANSGVCRNATEWTALNNPGLMQQAN